MIAIIKYNAGNLASVQNALTRLGYESIITDDETIIRNSDKVIFPGVGEASSAMKYLREKKLDQILRSLTQPVLGICLGMQLMCKYSEEGDTDCLGIFDSVVKHFPAKKLVPHMGWNNFNTIKSELLKDITLTDNVYYVHSFYVEECSNTISTCDYIVNFSSALQKNNFYATQFHPEKSSNIGAKILQNFLEL